MLVTFLISFREGLEAFLLIGILLVYLRKLGGSRFAKWIYAGVAAGLVSALAVAFILQVVVDQFNDAFYRSLFTAVIMLIATCILTYMAIWMQKQARAHTEHAKQQLETYIGSGSILGVVLLAYVSVLREGVETVLFLSALAYSGESLSISGGLAGLALAVLLVWLMVTGMRRVPLAVFFRYTSLLLIVIAAGLLGSAVNMLQVAGVVPLSLTPLFDISGLLPDTEGPGAFLRGLFGYNSTPTTPQFVLWALYLAVAVVIWYRAYAQKA